MAKTAEAKRVAFDEALEEMTKSGEVVSREKNGRRILWLPDAAPPVPDAESALAHLREIANGSGNQVLGEAQLKKLLPREQRAFLQGAIWLAVEERTLLQVTMASGKRAKSLYLSGAWARSQIAVEAVARPPAALEVEAVKRAYRQIVDETAFPDVYISFLRERAGCALEALQEWIRAEHSAGRAALSTGDWSLAAARHRQAAIRLGGGDYLLVRLLT